MRKVFTVKSEFPTNAKGDQLMEKRNIREIVSDAPIKSSAVKAAIADPEGAFIALWTYGLSAGFPDIGVGPMQLKGGEAGWEEALRRAQPLWLGVAWRQIERYEDRQDVERSRKEKDVPVLQWTAAAEGVAPGNYSAEITEIIEEEGNYGAQLRFQFVILDDDDTKTQEQIRAWCSLKWGESTKLYKWAKVILGKKCPAPQQPLDTDRLVGKRCDLSVGPYQRKDGSTGGKVEDLYPFRSINRPEDDEDDDKPY